MRRNFFLHFLNRDTREIARVYDLLGREKHAFAIRAPLNAAAMLCEDMCVAPPGFVLEDELAFELFEAQSAFLESGLIRLPIRDRNLADYAEKKRSEYAPARSRYSGLFDDSRMTYLSSLGEAIIPRQVQIGPAIVKGFQIGVDTAAPAWKGIRQAATPTVIENLRQTPGRLANDGKALTWAIMQPYFLAEGASFQPAMRDALQNVYFREYCREFKLIALSDIPYLLETFYLPIEKTVYSYRRLHVFLSTLRAETIFLQASGRFIVQMRNTPGFVELMDAYVGMARMYPTDQTLRYHTGRAVDSSTFDWHALAARRLGALSDPTEVEVLEISHACSDLAGLLTLEHGLSTRASLEAGSTSSRAKSTVGGRPLKIVLFVALEEELEVLLGLLDLKRLADQPVATGKLGKVALDILCPRAMGRVPAAVEITRYLAQTSTKPDLVLCVGLAGGFTESGIDAGTVICADTVVDLANRKVRDDEEGLVESKFRRRDYSCSKALYSVATSNEFDHKEWEDYCREKFDWPRGRVPSLREGKIASVDEVLASDVHRKRMIDSVDNLLGVEMESGGIGAAVSAFGLPFAVVRVVSDFADPSKADDRWRKLGMKTLAELIRRLPFERVIEVASQ